MSDLPKKTFVVTRFDPDRDEAPRTESYEVQPLHQIGLGNIIPGIVG